MSLWIKICGNTSLEDAKLAADAGADAVGFVFAPSPRRVMREQVAAIVPLLPSSLDKIGVFVDATLDEIAATVVACGLTGVQLHWQAPRELTAALRTRFGPQLRILRVVHFTAAAPEPALVQAQDENADAILVDSRTATTAGGTGQSYDWDLAGKTLFQDMKERRLVAAGGLTPDNVAEAISALRPWGVDTVSGVEAAPGRKDAAKVREFVKTARAASAAAN